MFQILVFKPNILLLLLYYTFYHDFSTTILKLLNKKYHKSLNTQYSRPIKFRISLKIELHIIISINNYVFYRRVYHDLPVT